MSSQDGYRDLLWPNPILHHVFSDSFRIFASFTVNLRLKTSPTLIWTRSWVRGVRTLTSARSTARSSARLDITALFRLAVTSNSIAAPTHSSARNLFLVADFKATGTSPEQPRRPPASTTTLAHSIFFTPIPFASVRLVDPGLSAVYDEGRDEYVVSATTGIRRIWHPRRWCCLGRMASCSGGEGEADCQ